MRFRHNKVAAAGFEPAAQEKVKRNVVLVLQVKINNVTASVFKGMVIYCLITHYQCG